jgi:lipopolysaccharide transport system ATP-binding protein
MADPITIQAEQLSKCYRVFSSPRARLAQGLWRGTRKFYEPFWALKDVSFELEAGQTMGVVGRNGSGKSTLLQLLCGTLTPTSGTVAIEGRVAALLELGSGFNPEFTGLENIYLNAALLGLNKEETDANLDAILAFADIGDFVQQPVKTYSSGMALRLAFAVQANIQPDVLVVDEALAVGDEFFQRKCFKHLETLKSRGTSILLVTHNCGQILQHCDQAMLLHRGQLEFIGRPKSITTIYQRLINSNAEDWRAQAQNLFMQLEADADLPDPERESEAEASLDVDGSGYDPNLKPESRMAYPSRGLRIETMQTLDAAGQRCNVLHQGETFSVVLRYQADEAVENLELACSITDKAGQLITGQRFPELGQSLQPINSGTNFSCCFRFKGSLQPGLYFLNAGAWNCPEKIYLHRIIDGCAIRILLPRKTSFGFGLVDLSSSAPELINTESATGMTDRTNERTRKF